MAEQDELDVVNDERVPAEPASPARTAEKKLVEQNGEIGYVTKSRSFVPLTNYSVRCTGYVVDNAASTSANGFMFDIVPRTSVRVDDEDGFVGAEEYLRLTENGDELSW